MSNPPLSFSTRTTFRRSRISSIGSMQARASCGHHQQHEHAGVRPRITVTSSNVSWCARSARPSKTIEGGFRHEGAGPSRPCDELIDLQRVGKPRQYPPPPPPPPPKTGRCLSCSCHASTDSAVCRTRWKLVAGGVLGLRHPDRVGLAGEVAGCRPAGYYVGMSVYGFALNLGWKPRPSP